jgi:hypothetical protein
MKVGGLYGVERDQYQAAAAAFRARCPICAEAVGGGGNTRQAEHSASDEG